VVATHGIDLMAAHWDNLILLDACCYDMFERLDIPDGELWSVVLKGSNTPEFAAENFGGGTPEDTVYVTANPQLYRIENEYDTDPIDVEFVRQIDVWRDNWHDTPRTVMLDVVTDAALRATEEHPTSG
jgi:hypothetical protein